MDIYLTKDCIIEEDRMNIKEEGLCHIPKETLEAARILNTIDEAENKYNPGKNHVWKKGKNEDDLGGQKGDPPKTRRIC